MTISRQRTHEEGRFEMTTEAAPRNTDLQIICSDSHVAEPADLWTSRISSKWGDAAPRVVISDVTGEPVWLVADELLTPVALYATAGYPEPIPNYPPTLDDADPGTFDPHARLRWLDRFGIKAQVLFPNILAFFGDVFMKLDPALALECVRVYNDHVTEFSAADPDRLLPLTQLPFWDVDASVAEMERCAERNHRGVVFAGILEGAGLPNIDDTHWDPILDAAQSLGQSLNFHLGFATHGAVKSLLQKRRSEPAEDLPLIGYNLLSNARAINLVIASGLCQRFPDLKFVSTESGFGYIPYLLQSADWFFSEVPMDKRNGSMPPSEYFKRQVYGTVWFEDLRDSQVAEFQDNLMFETDYPHEGCISPRLDDDITPQGMIEKNFKGLPKQVTRKIVHDNAAALYRVK
jgi:predicted TIM-barrel fold metal-dependent hydrolase